MPHHTKSWLLGLAALCVCAWAQEPPTTIIGTTAQVQGLVTVSYGSTVASVRDDSPLIDGSRYVTSSSGRAVLKFSDGCTVKLEPNQWIAVDGSQSCGVRIAAVQSFGQSQAGLAMLPADIQPLLTLATVMAAGGIDWRRNGGNRLPGNPLDGGAGGGIPNPPPTVQ